MNFTQIISFKGQRSLNSLSIEMISQAWFGRINYSFHFEVNDLLFHSENCNNFEIEISKSIFKQFGWNVAAVSFYSDANIVQKAHRPMSHVLGWKGGTGDRQRPYISSPPVTYCRLSEPTINHPHGYFSQRMSLGYVVYLRQCDAKTGDWF